ncbi:hypothetical protein ACKKBF_B01380 [Auxenochlorella protothecoides x Auxenochlorella symbiontica]
MSLGTKSAWAIHVVKARRKLSKEPRMPKKGSKSTPVAEMPVSEAGDVASTVVASDKLVPTTPDASTQKAGLASKAPDAILRKTKAISEMPTSETAGLAVLAGASSSQELIPAVVTEAVINAVNNIPPQGPIAKVVAKAITAASNPVTSKELISAAAVEAVDAAGDPAASEELILAATNEAIQAICQGATPPASNNSLANVTLPRHEEEEEDRTPEKKVVAPPPGFGGPVPAPEPPAAPGPAVPANEASLTDAEEMAITSTGKYWACIKTKVPLIHRSHVVETGFLGAGTYGRVSRVCLAGAPWEAGLPTEAALKLFDPRLTPGQRMKAVLQEVRSLRMVRGPTNVALVGIVTDDVGCPEGVLMEHCNGGHLYEYMRQNPGMDEVSQVKLLCSMARALANLHELGIVHCDIKPCNILVCVDANGEPTAKLVDFSGAFRPTADGRPPHPHDMWEGVAVTYAFCPNEGFKRPQMSGDVWAMACSMLELLQPGALGNGWEGKEYQRARGHKEHPARPLLHLIDGLPAGVLLRVIRALAFAPEQRCTAAELAEALEVHLQVLADPAHDHERLLRIEAALLEPLRARDRATAAWLAQRRLERAEREREERAARVEAARLLREAEAPAAREAAERAARAALALRVPAGGTPATPGEVERVALDARHRVTAGFVVACPGAAVDLLVDLDLAAHLHHGVTLQLPALLDPAQVDAGAGRCPHAALCRAVLDAARARLQACEGYAEAVAEACRLGWCDPAAPPPPLVEAQGAVGAAQAALEAALRESRRADHQAALAAAVAGVVAHMAAHPARGAARATGTSSDESEESEDSTDSEATSSSDELKSYASSSESEAESSALEDAAAKSSVLEDAAAEMSALEDAVVNLSALEDAAASLGTRGGAPPQDVPCQHDHGIITHPAPSVRGLSAPLPQAAELNKKGAGETASDRPGSAPAGKVRMGHGGQAPLANGSVDHGRREERPTEL